MSENERDTVTVTIVSGDRSYTYEYPRQDVEDAMMTRPYIQELIAADMQRMFEEEVEVPES